MVGEEKRLIPSPDEEVLLPGELCPDVHALIVVARMKRVGGDRPAGRLALQDVGRDSELEEERQAPRFQLDVGRYLVVRALLRGVHTDEGARVAARELHIRAEIGEGGADRHAAEEIRLEGRSRVESEGLGAFVTDRLPDVFPRESD